MREGLVSTGLVIVVLVTYHRMTGQVNGPISNLLSIILSSVALLLFIASAAFPARSQTRDYNPLVRIAVGLCVLAMLLGVLIVVVIASRCEKEPAGVVAFHQQPFHVPIPTPP